MDLKLSKDQEMLQREARHFFRQQMPIEKVLSLVDSDTGFDPDLWRAMAELGWLGVVVPEEYGGVGGTFLDLVVLLQEIGRAGVPTPYFATVLLGAVPIIDLGSEAQKRKYLPSIAAGDSIFSLAMVEEEGNYDPASVQTMARRERSGFRLSGCKLFVPHGLVADTLICIAREHDDRRRSISSFVVDAKQAGVTRARMKTITNQFYAEVSLKEAIAGADDRLTSADDGWNSTEGVLLKAAVGSCALAVGGAEHVLDMTVQYAKDRVQFDRPIGSFQAIQHHCADMLTEIDACRLLTYEAAWRIAAGLPFELEAAAAKAWCGESYERVTKLGHQVHGGVGLIKEHAMYLYSRDARSTASLLGGSDYQREVIAGFLERTESLL
ncbi:MAG: acyl-CoA dehydrogenase [Chloroflexota bacterium]|nr:MAG: acyl-CoA dehydrogenase [Chloroflexota bacterium]